MNFFKYFIFFVLLTLTVTAHTEASTSSGTIDSSSKITRICQDVSCSTFGQVNWKPTLNTNTTGATAISITDSAITGHLWGNQLGWINLAPTGSGVFVSPSTGVLSGMAFSSTGSWINFAPQSVSGGTQVGVSINTSGEFVGWAWVSGAYGGWMKFDCTDSNTCIKTDWRPLSAREVSTNESASGGAISGQRHFYSSSTTTVDDIIIDTGPLNTVPPLTYKESKPNTPDILNVQDDEKTDGVEIVGEMNNNKGKKGQYKELFPRRSKIYTLTQECLMCITLHRDVLGISTGSGYVFKRDILKFAFVPQKFEIRIPIYKIKALQDRVPFALPDLDGTSTMIAFGGFWIIGRILRSSIKNFQKVLQKKKHF